MHPRFRQVIRLLLRLAVLGAVLAWLLHDLDFALIRATFSRLSWWIFPLAVAMQVSAQALQALRWKVLVGRKDVPYLDYLGFVASAYAMALFSPSLLFSDSASAWFLGKRNQAVVKSVSAMLAGRVMGLVAALGFVAFTLPGHLWMLRGMSWNPTTGLLVALGGMAVAMAAGGWLFLRKPAWLLPWLDRAGRVFGEIRFVLTRPASLVFGLVLSFFAQGLLIVISWMGFHAMGIPVSFFDVVFLAPFITIVTLVPGLGQIGVREGISVFLFTLLPGVTKEHMLASFGYGYTLFALTALFNLGLVLRILRPRPAA